MIKRWDEKKIKAILIDYLLKNKSSSSVICAEVPFLGGKRWADIVELKENSLTAYEIKSDLDSFVNLEKQLLDYTETFNEVYVVLSKKFTGKQKDLPQNIGYFWLDPDKGRVVLKRKSKKKNKPSKKNLSYFLWKKDLPSEFKNSKFSIEIIRDEFIKNSTKKNLQSQAIKALKKRYKDRFELFLREKSPKTHFSEINVLTKKETSIG